MDRIYAPDGGRQIAFDLPPAPARLTREAFVIGQSNAPALQTMEAWAAFSDPLLAICGPEGSGKTHLAHILADMIGARYVRPGADDVAGSLAAGDAGVVIDAADCVPSARYLLALVEAAGAAGRRLVLVGRGEPHNWAKGLKDLETRLNAAARITLAEPDEALLRAVIVKLFSDRQLRASEQIADYAARRIEKTFAAAHRFVATLDAASIEKGQPIGLKLAREIIANLSEAPLNA